MRRVVITASLTVALLAVGPWMSMTSSARADAPIKSLYVGLHGGADVPLDDWDFGQVRQNRPEIGGVVGLRVGLHATWWLAAEIGVTTDIFADDAGGSNVALNISADLLFHLIKGDWVPFLDVGAGAFVLAAGDLDGDADYHIHWGLGVRGMLLDFVALRVDARHILGDPAATDAVFSNLLELTVGVDVYAWQEDHTPPDTDKDGVADPDDACVNEAGTAATGGCPDGDGDGVIDSQDSCPATPGKADLKGCPDTDGDGIADSSDRCPKEAGATELKGCPDGDGDGIADIDDSCPKAAGEKSRKGCPPPDKDSDGVIDSEDECPSAPGTPAHKGCPDTDGDGIRDRDDTCPKLPGVKEESGCLPKEVSRFSWRHSRYPVQERQRHDPPQRLPDVGPGGQAAGQMVGDSLARGGTHR